MTNQRTVAARDCKGKLFWFPVDEAERWSVTTRVGCDLYRVAGSWPLRDSICRRRTCLSDCRTMDDG